MSDLMILAYDENGDSHDITEGVRVLYDLLCSSMDWGSGFLDTEEVNQVREVEEACGFDHIDYKNDKCSHCGHISEYHSYNVVRTCYVNLDEPERHSTDWVNWVKQGKPGSNCSCPGYEWDGK